MSEAEEIILNVDQKTKAAISDINKAESIEVISKSSKEAVIASLDAIDFASDGNIWGINSIGVSLEPGGIFEKGSHVNFIPIKGSTAEHWRGMFTLSEGINNPNISGSVFEEGRTTDGGKEIKDMGLNLPGMDAEQVLHGVASATMGVAASKL